MYGEMEVEVVMKKKDPKKKNRKGNMNVYFGMCVGRS